MNATRLLATPGRYARLLGIQARTAAIQSMQYRLDFVVQCGTAIFWTVSALIPLLVVFSQRDGVAGWTWPEALMVVGFFTLLKGVLSAAIQPALTSVVEHVRRGTLDFLLLKPVDAQFMVSTSKLELTNISHFVAGLAIIAWASWKSGRPPGLTQVLLCGALLVVAVAILYSLWIFAVSMAFYFVRIDNLSYLIVSTYDAARWPASVFRGVFAFAFTFIVPLALMTTYPALALLGRISGREVLMALALAAAFLAASRLTWLRSLARYSGAGG